MTMRGYAAAGQALIETLIVTSLVALGTITLTASFVNLFCKFMNTMIVFIALPIP